jgi:hypothetical protein
LSQKALAALAGEARRGVALVGLGAGVATATSVEALVALARLLAPVVPLDGEWTCALHRGFQDALVAAALVVGGAILVGAADLQASPQILGAEIPFLAGLLHGILDAGTFSVTMLPNKDGVRGTEPPLAAGLAGGGIGGAGSVLVTHTGSAAFRCRSLALIAGVASLSSYPTDPHHAPRSLLVVLSAAGLAGSFTGLVAAHLGHTEPTATVIVGLARVSVLELVRWPGTSACGGVTQRGGHAIIAGGTLGQTLGALALEVARTGGNRRVATVAVGGAESGTALAGVGFTGSGSAFGRLLRLASARAIANARKLANPSALGVAIVMRVEAVRNVLADAVDPLALGSSRTGLAIARAGAVAADTIDTRSAFAGRITPTN